MSNVSSQIPLFATQGGGFATYQGDRYVWHSEIPSFMGSTQIGDPIPDEWDIVPLNEEARLVLEGDDSL